MKLKELEGYLQQITTFQEPDYRLEQYPTTPHIAARMLFTIDSVYDDIEAKHVGDFGCGGGTLGLGCAILGAGSVLGIDIDPKSLELAKQNAADMDLEEETDFILADVAALAAHDSGERWGEAARATGADERPSGAADVQPEPEPEPHELESFLKSAFSEVVEQQSGDPMAAMAVLCRARAATFSAADRAEYARYLRQDQMSSPLESGKPRRRGPGFDTVVMNPPFGTRNRGIDVLFLQHAIKSVVDGGAVYSLHKSTTREHLYSAATAMGAKPELVAELRFDIPAMYVFHKETSKDVAVDLLRFVVGGAPPGTVVECPHFETDEERQAIRDRMSPSQQRRASGGSRGGNRGRGRGRGGRVKVKGAHGNRKR